MGGFSGIPSIMKNFKKTYPNTPISSKIVQNFLNLQTPYSLHQKRFKKLSRNMTYAPRVNTQWTVDLIDFPDFEPHNDGYRYILVVIDCLSRFVYTEPIKTKSADDVAVAFEKIFKRAEHLPVVLNSDEGNEFRNKKVIALFKKHNIHSFVSFGNITAKFQSCSSKTVGGDRFARKSGQKKPGNPKYVATKRNWQPCPKLFLEKCALSCI